MKIRLVNKMTWYIALTDTKDCFPIWYTEETNSIEIPKQPINSSFTFDKETWIITEKYPVVENETITWMEKKFAQLVTFQKMWCLPDIDRIMAQRAMFVSKTLLIDEKDYPLTSLKWNEYHSAVFNSLVDGKYYEIMFRDDDMYLGDDKNGQWIKKDIMWKE